MKFLVTGGSGFIGSHLVDAILQRGDEAVVLDDLSTGRRENLAHLAGKPGLRVLDASLLDAEALGEALAGVEVVLHQAAIPSVPRSVEDPLGTNDANIKGTLLLLEQARHRGVRRVVLASSSSVYGNAREAVKHEGLELRPLSPYAVQKATLELYARAYSAMHGLDTVCLRYFNVFGERQNARSQYAAAIPAFVSAVLVGRSPTVFGDGEQTRDFTHVSNVVRANLLAADSGRQFRGDPINIACGERISVNAVIGLIGELLGQKVEPTYLPERVGDVRDSLASIERARSELGYEPQTGLREGLGLVISSMAAAMGG